MSPDLIKRGEEEQIECIPTLSRLAQEQPVSAASQRERPILFSAPMVRALLEGRKTQTRRIVKPAPVERGAMRRPLISFNHGVAEYSFGPEDVTAKGDLRWWRCPYGRPGDLLWVRETWGVGTRPCPHQGWRDGIEYRADCEGDDAPPLHEIIPDHVEPDSIRQGWRSPIYMPRWASRITLRVTDVRVERLSEIGEEDALAEGIKHWGDGFHWEANAGWPGEPVGLKSMRFVGLTAKQAYRGLWEEINGRESLDANPWVWAVSFERVGSTPTPPAVPLEGDGKREGQ